MTAAEAASQDPIVRAIASRAGVDRRTAIKCLLGQSPCSTMWMAVDHAAKALGVTQIPQPVPRKPRAPKPCASCAAKAAEIEALRAEVVGCAYCGASHPRDPTSLTNLYCARCREASHARVEAENKALRDENKELRAEVARLQAEAPSSFAEIVERVGTLPTTVLASAEPIPLPCASLPVAKAERPACPRPTLTIVIPDGEKPAG